jgi:hypothetical protein
LRCFGALCAAQLFLGIRFGARRLLPGLALTVLSVAGVSCRSGPPGTGAWHFVRIAGNGTALRPWLAARNLGADFRALYIGSGAGAQPAGRFGMALSYYHDQVLLGYVAVPYLVAALFLSNRRTIKSSASMQSGLALRIVHQNFLMMIVLVAILLLLSISAQFQTWSPSWSVRASS